MPLFGSMKSWFSRRGGKGGERAGRTGFRAVSPLVLNLLLLPLFAYDLYGQVGAMLGAINFVGQGGAGQGSEQVQNVEKKDKYDFASVAQWQPFGGQEAPKPKIELQDTKDLPETGLNFVLRGVLYVDGKTIPAFALIKLPDAPEKAFAVGDELTGGVRLAGIQDDRVILDRGGRLETLKLPRSELKIRDPDA